MTSAMKCIIPGTTIYPSLKMSEMVNMAVIHVRIYIRTYVVGIPTQIYICIVF